MPSLTRSTDTLGCMVTRYRVETECGGYLTDDGCFTYEIDDAAQFRTEGEANEEAGKHPGTEVVRFERYSAFPDITPAVQIESARTAA